MNTQLIKPDYVGPITNFNALPHKREMLSGVVWEVLGSVPQSSKDRLTSKGVIILCENGKYKCVVPCQFSGIRLLGGLRHDPSVNRPVDFNPMLLRDFFFVTTPQSPNWDLFDARDTQDKFRNVPFLDKGKQIAFIDNRHLCLVSATSSERVVTLPGQVLVDNIKVISPENLQQFGFRVSLSGEANGLYSCNLKTGRLIKLS